MFRSILKALRPWPKHPIDVQYGIETSSRVSHHALRTGDAEADAANVGYAGSQPSIIREALRTLPDAAGAAFVDLGCGKGRALAVASEFPFASLLGLELSSDLCALARKNAARIAARHPERTPIEIVEGDATRPPMPDHGDVVLFFYNSFRAPLVARLIDHIAASVKDGEPRVFVVSYNPVNAALFDAHPLFQRHYAVRREFAPEELKSSPFGNRHDSVVVWQAKSGRPVPAHPGADRRVQITMADVGADVVMD